MHNRKIFPSILLALMLLAGCRTSGGEEAAPVCGDGLCDSTENAQDCPEDCSQPFPAGSTLLTQITSEGIGEIAVLIAYPDTTRFPEGAGVVVVVPSFLSGQDAFTLTPDLTSIGLIQVTYLPPGGSDERFEAQSDGENDFGGEDSLQVLRDVLRFAAGRYANIEGRSMTTLLPVKPLVDETGIYAFSDAGVVVLNVLARYGTELDGVEYFVSDENPTVDTLLCREAGHVDPEGSIKQNPFYLFPASYSPDATSLNYGTLRWDPACTDAITSLPGCPYLDLDGDEQLSAADHVFPAFVQMFGKRYYSRALTQALLENNVLSNVNWSPTLATVEETAEAWNTRLPESRFHDLVLQMPDLKVMLLFSRLDHAQAAADKPHIHQAFQGFRFESLLRWVRLNPDRAYLQQVTGLDSLSFPDNPANTQPEDWLEISSWSYASLGLPQDSGPLAALAEMSDRAHTGRWDENLGDSLYDYIPATPEPR
jgi:hypothetical protein